MKNRRMKAAFLLIVCMLTLLTVMNSAETTTALYHGNQLGNGFAALGYYCDIGKNIHEVLGWAYVTGYWGGVIGFAVGGPLGILVGIGVGL